MTLQQFLFILRARARLALMILMVTVLTTFVVSLVLPKQYTASTAVVIDVKSPDPVAGVFLPGMITPGYMATQVDIIGSDRVAQRVVKLLRLDQNADVRQQWQDTTEGRGKLEVWLGDLLQKNLDVKPSRESNVINIAYTASDPAFAAALANAFVQAYIEVNLELKVDGRLGGVDDQGLLVLERGEFRQDFQRDLFGWPGNGFATECDVAGFKPGGDGFHGLGAGDFLQFGEGCFAGCQGNFLQHVDAPLAEEIWVVFVIFFDVGFGWFGHARSDLFEIGFGDNFAFGIFDRHHDVGGAIQFAFASLLDGQLLVDEFVEYLPLGRVGLFGGEVWQP